MMTEIHAKAGFFVSRQERSPKKVLAPGDFLRTRVFFRLCLEGRRILEKGTDRRF